MLVLCVACSVANAQINAQLLGRYSIGTYNSNGGVAEISAYDPGSKRMFVINGPDSSVKIVNIANPASPVLIATISVKPYGIDVTSVACNKKGVFAISVIDSNGKTNPSNIVFLDINGNYINKVKAGANADHVIFTPNGQKLLVANEGEPNVGYTIDPEGSISIIDLASGIANITQANVQTAGFTAFNSPTVIDSKIRIFGKIQSGTTFSRNSTVAEDLEPEYIAISDDNTTAWVTCQENNALAVVNINTATVTSLLPLGYKNHRLAGNGLDPSDRDNGSNAALAKIDTFPVFGMFLPDGISHFKAGNQSYLVTANEGDARADYGTANNEENRVADVTYVLDSTKFGGAAGVAAIKANTALGRLTVSNRTGDFNNDGKIDSIFCFGARSFSIWNGTTGALVWDSKDEIEQKVKSMFPANFNTGHTTNALDDRSDNKGPEPESVTIGKIKDSTYAFIGLERIGGIMIYNITIPTAPYFVQYINTRNFSVTPSQANLASVGDLGPEGIVFIPASESPNGVNMIMLSNEVSGTVAIFNINTPETEGISKLQDYKNNTSAAIGTFQGINYKEAGFSTLFPIPNTNGTEFWTCSDRGVNIDCANANTASCRPTYDKMYAFPSYSPKIHRIRINGDSIQILQTIPIKRPNGSGASGIINPTGLGSTAAEIASTDTVLNCANFSLKTTPKDTFGIDPEGLVVDKNGDFWLCEEGGATIWKLNKNGVLVNRFTPYAHLSGKQAIDIQIDSVFKYRKNNRGFEGISIAPNGKIYAMIQSGIQYPTVTIGDNTRIHRILEIDPATNNQRMLVYLNDGIIGTGSNQIRLRDWKIGDMAAVNDSTFLVLEAAARGTSDIKRLYQININQATAVHSGLYGTLTLEGLVDSTGLANNGIKPVTKTLVMDLLASGWPAELDKAEGLAIINDSTIAIGNDNDFGQTSPLANGIATATGNLSHLITYRLSGAKKLANYKPSELTTFNLLAPTTNSKIVTNSTNNNPINFSWNKTPNGVTYKWFITPSSGTFNNPWLVAGSAFSGTDTTFRYQYLQFDTLAAQKGIAKGDSVLLKWTVYAYTGNDSIMAAQSNNLWLVRENIIIPPPTLGAFNLLTPANNARVEVEQGTTTPVTVRWSKSNNALMYKWFVTTATGNFNAPIAVMPSNISATDTTLTLISGTVDALLASVNIKKGDSVMLKWTVFSYKNGGLDSLKASQDFNINIVRKRKLLAFNLIAPADNARLEVEQNETTPVVISWAASASGVTYKWLLDAASGNFANPWAVMSADNSGSDTKLSLTAGAIDNLVAGKGVADGDSVSLKWTVRAYETGDSLQAIQTFNVKVLRKKAVGLVEKELNTLVKVYPNPAHSEININFENLNKQAQIMLFDATGKKVASAAQSTNENVKLNIEGFAKGIYLLHIQVDGSSIKHKLVIE